MKDYSIRVGGRVVEISRPDKELFPGDGITKRNLAEYYQKVAPKMLPFLKDRPISMRRFPNGIAEQGFYEKKLPEHFPDWVGRVRVKVKEGGSQEQVMVNNAATLVFLADQACITPHTWLSRKDKLDYPDKMIFDLDPAELDLAAMKAAAFLLKDVVEQAGLAAFVMTTGIRGLHVVAPLARKENFDQVRKFARALADDAAAREPKSLTTEARIASRKGRIFVDYLRNAYGQTSVPPYAVRARPGAPVAVPLRWEELDSPRLTPSSYDTRNVFERLRRIPDPWQGFYRRARALGN